MSINGRNETQTNGENLRRTLDIQGDKLNELTSNNRQVFEMKLFLWITIFVWLKLSNVQSQLARLRSELEKSEMLRQTLEYELTLLRTQHGKQTAFTQQLHQQLHLSTEQIKQFQAEKHFNNEQNDQIIKEKDKQIKELITEAETLHDRERFLFFHIDLIIFTIFFFYRRIEALNQQIRNMES